VRVGVNVGGTTPSHEPKVLPRSCPSDTGPPRSPRRWKR
jgi:hypothetical protein